MRFAAFLLVAATILAGVSSCSSKNESSRSNESASATQTSARAGEPAHRDTGWTGAVSEEEFKAMHQLSKDKVPPPRGVTVDLAGSRAYLSVPEGKPPFPGLIVIHEWWGLNDHIRHWSDRLASDGYAALAVDLYGGRVADNPDSAMSYVKSVDEKRALQILAAADSFLASDPRVQSVKRGSIGWCFGGGWSLQTALNRKDLDACVLYYGRPVTTPESFRDFHTPILGIFGNLDKSITPAMVNEFEKTLEAAGVTHEIHRYDAPHAFANPSGTSYNEPAAADAWEKTRTFLSKYLKSS